MSFLGRFLVEQGAITEAQLAEGLAYQREKNRRIGEVAVERGMLTSEQAEDIRVRQNVDPRLFGDIAVGQRQLSRRAVDDLLFLQKIHHTYLGEALLVLGHIDRSQYQALMGRHYALRDKGRMSLRYLQEFFAENRVGECLFAALSRALLRWTGEEAAANGLDSAHDPAEYPEQARIEGTVLGQRRFAATIGLSRPLVERLAQAGPGLDAFYATVLHYFGDMLRDKGLRLETGTLLPAVGHPQDCQDCLVVRAHTPSGQLGLTFWLQEAAA